MESWSKTMRIKPYWIVISLVSIVMFAAALISAEDIELTFSSPHCATEGCLANCHDQVALKIVTNSVLPEPMEMGTTNIAGLVTLVCAGMTNQWGVVYQHTNEYRFYRQVSVPMATAQLRPRFRLPRRTAEGPQPNIPPPLPGPIMYREVSTNGVIYREVFVPRGFHIVIEKEL